MSDRFTKDPATSSHDPSKGISLSVIIPTRNGEDGFRELLASLSIQSLQPDEIVVVDTASEDGTVEIAHQYGADVTQIALEEFDHGATRTKAARNAVGDILVFLTQDVVPASRTMLETLVQPIQTNDRIDVSYARQLPAFDATRVAAHLRSFNYPEEPAQRSFEDRQRLGFGAVFVSNSCAAFRKSSLAEIGYFKAGLIFGEDSWAAGRILERGGIIAYTPAAAVYHSHNYRWHEDLRRYFDIGVFHDQGGWLIDTFGGAGQRGMDYIRSGISELWSSRSYSAIGDFMVRVVLKFGGYRLGRMHRFLPRKAARFLSMNQRWWDKKNTGIFGNGG